MFIQFSCHLSLLWTRKRSKSNDFFIFRHFGRSRSTNSDLSDGQAWANCETFWRVKSMFTRRHIMPMPFREALTPKSKSGCRTDPCVWKFVKETAQGPQLQVLVLFRIDDFMLVGRKGEGGWEEFQRRTDNKWKWSEWEQGHVRMTGVDVSQLHDGSLLILGQHRPS